MQNVLFLVFANDGLYLPLFVPTTIWYSELSGCKSVDRGTIRNSDNHFLLIVNVALYSRDPRLYRPRVTTLLPQQQPSSHYQLQYTINTYTHTIFQFIYIRPQQRNVFATRGRSSLNPGNVQSQGVNNFGSRWNFDQPQVFLFAQQPLWGNGINAGNPQQRPAANAVVGRPGFVQQMVKWNLKFSGTNSDEFLFRVETLARSANIEQDRIPDGNALHSSRRRQQVVLGVL